MHNNSTHLRVSQSAVVKDLQQQIPDFAMRLLELVQQQDLVRLATNGFGQDASFL